jgi:hypothetical protein
LIAGQGRNAQGADLGLADELQRCSLGGGGEERGGDKKFHSEFHDRSPF